jgi:hypothetical protein
MITRYHHMLIDHIKPSYITVDIIIGSSLIYLDTAITI